MAAEGAGHDLKPYGWVKSLYPRLSALLQS